MKSKQIELSLMLILLLLLIIISLKENVLFKSNNNSNVERIFLPNLITGAPIGTLGVTILSSVTISLLVDSVNFSEMYPGETDNTTDNLPLPFQIRNDGTTFVNVTIEATNLFNATGASNPSNYYGYKTESNCDGPASPAYWRQMPAQGNPQLAIHALDYTDSNDTAEVEVGIVIPINEPAGIKSSLVTFIGIDAS